VVFIDVNTPHSLEAPINRKDWVSDSCLRDCTLEIGAANSGKDFSLNASVDDLNSDHPPVTVDLPLHKPVGSPGTQLQ